MHVNVTRAPTNPWVAQQLREATLYGQTPTYLIRDNDRKFGQHFARVAITSSIKVLQTPYRTTRLIVREVWRGHEQTLSECFWPDVSS